MKNNTLICPTFNVGDMDLSFVHEMVKGGISDDGGCNRDIYFEDNKNYDEIPVTNDELNAFLEKYSLNMTRF